MGFDVGDLALDHELHRSRVACKFEHDCAGVRIALEEWALCGEDSAGGVLLEGRKGSQGASGRCRRGDLLCGGGDLQFMVPCRPTLMIQELIS